MVREERFITEQEAQEWDYKDCLHRGWQLASSWNRKGNVKHYSDYRKRNAAIVADSPRFGVFIVEVELRNYYELSRHN